MSNTPIIFNIAKAPRYASLRQAARLLGCSHQTVANQAAKGVFPNATRMWGNHGLHLIPLADIEAVLKMRGEELDEAKMQEVFPDLALPEQSTAA